MRKLVLPCLLLIITLRFRCGERENWRGLVCILGLIFIKIDYVISIKQTHLFFTHFSKITQIYWMITWWIKQIVFKSRKFSPRALLSSCLIFCPFQPGVVSKCVAYKKECVIFKYTKQIIPFVLSKNEMLKDLYLKKFELHCII